MTLIIGKIKDNQIRFISDSKITDEYSVRNNVLAGSLKLFILNPQTCMGFAGNLHFAEQLLSEIYNNKIPTFPALIQKCLSINIESNDSTVFCIGFYDRNEPRLLKIAGKSIQSNQKNVWIGDKLGFEKYQQNFHESKIEDDFSKMESAFDNVIKDEKIPTISDFQISIETIFQPQLNSFIFAYTDKFLMSYAPQNFTMQINPGEKSATHHLGFGGADIGGFGTSYLRSINVFQPAIAIHFPQGEFGVLFCPQINYNKPIIFTQQPDGENFAIEIWEKYKIALQGFVAKDGFAFKYIVTSPKT
ncbi:hypothetical protein [Flavobacterium sp.]|uniref:hypothetical protein n=1 Tax=Flavobacterium sp. TaxID=239 RepID=UPI0026179C93|nr:hypothetical protein [Flavobacterium sp.]